MLYLYFAVTWSWEIFALCKKQTMLTAAFQDSDYSILNSFPSIKDRNSTGRSGAPQAPMSSCLNIALQSPWHLGGSGYYILIYWCPMGPTLFTKQVIYTISATFFSVLDCKMNWYALSRISILMTFLIEKWLELHFRIGLLRKLFRKLQMFWKFKSSRLSYKSVSW